MRKQEWKKILSAVVAASMVFSLAPINVGTASAQTEQTAASGEKTAAQSITDVLDQGIKDTTNFFGVSAWYFPNAIEGVVDAGTLYLEGTGSSWIGRSKGKDWEKSNPDKPIRAMIVKDANIDQNSFSDLNELKKVKLEGVPSIGSQGFASCPNLQEIDLGEALTSLGTNAFSNDISLTHIRIPAGVTKLQSYVFSGCTSLRDVAICTTEAQPDMGSTAATTFASTQSLIYCYSGRGGMEHPFIGCSDLIIYVAERGNGIETAMDFTYKDCVGGNWTSLASVTYSVSTLDQYEAKQQVTGELTVSCPDPTIGEVPEPKITKNETGIASDNVKWQYFNKNKKSISGDDVTAKMGQRYVKAVLQDDTHFAYMSDFVPFQVQAPLTYTIENGVLKIAPKDGVEQMAMPDFDEPGYSDSEVFAPWKDEEYTSIEIAEGITSIGSYAFAQTSGLKEVVLGKNVTSIGELAFYDSGLELLDLSTSGVISIGEGAFYGCSKLTRVKLSEKLENIQTEYMGCFQDCTSLRLVEGLENTNLTQIPDDTFNGCSSLANIQLPASVNKIGSSAFYGCTSLKNVIYQAGAEGTVNLGRNAFDGCSSLENVLLTGKNVTIESSAFSNCTSLKKLTIKEVTGESDSALSIANGNAFTNVTAMIYVPNATLQAAVREKLTSLDAYSGDADKDAAEQKIKVITAGDDSDIPVKKFSTLAIKLEEDAIDPGQAFVPVVAEKIGDGAITYWYYKLENGKYVLVDPDNPDAVPTQRGTYFIEGQMAESDTYYSCVSNRVLCIIHGKVTDENMEFDSKTGILSIKKSIGNLDVLKAVFSDCETRVKEVSWVETEEGYTAVPSFINYTALIKAENIPLNTSFRDCSSLTDVTFAKDYSDVIGSTLYSSTNAAGFAGCTSLREIAIPDAVTQIGRYAFQDCVSLEKVVFGKDSQLTTIAASLGSENHNRYNYGSSFQGCASLVSIDIPAGVTDIGESTFQDCSALREVNFLLKKDGTGSLTNIWKNAFLNCTSLERVALPEVQNGDGTAIRCDIWENAFSGCSALTSFEKTTPGEINVGAFQDCTKLSSVTFTNSCAIQNAAFANAGTDSDSLVVTMGDGSAISSNAFNRSGVTEIIVGSNTRLYENAMAGSSRLETVTLKEVSYTAQNAPAIANKNLTAGCPDDVVIYASGDSYDLLVDSGYTNAKDYKTVTEAKKAAFAAGEEIYKGLDASLYDAEALQDFLENTLPVAKDLVEDSTGESSTLNVFEQADIIDQAEAFLAEAYFGEGGLAEVPAAAVAKLTDGLEEAEYTAESWKALTDAQAAVAAFLETQAEGATSAQASEFEGLVKAAKAVQLVKKAEAGTPTPEPGKGTPEPGKGTPEPGKGTPEPGKGTPEPGKGTPEPGKGTPEPGKGTPEPGKGTPEPGKGTPEPGQGTPEPGKGTPEPGQNTPAPGQNTPAPGQGNTAPGQGAKTPGQGSATVQVPKLAAVKISKVTAKKKSVVIKWKKRAGAKGYQLSYSLKKNFKGAKTVSIKSSKSSYTIKKLKKGKTYYIRIRAYNTSSGKKQYGKWSAKKKVKIKK